MEKSSIVYSFLVRAHNLQILRIEQGSTPRIDRSFMLRSSVLLSQTLSVVHWAFLVSLPIMVDYLDRWAHRHQCHGHTSPWRRSTLDFRNRIHGVEASRADHCWAPCCLHPIPDWVNWPLLPRSDYKMEPFTRNRRYESSISIRARHHHCSCSSSS
jgi:hypothetical protein